MALTHGLQNLDPPGQFIKVTAISDDQRQRPAALISGFCVADTLAIDQPFALRDPQGERAGGWQRFHQHLIPRIQDLIDACIFGPRTFAH